MTVQAVSFNASRDLDVSLTVTSVCDIAFFATKTKCADPTIKMFFLQVAGGLGALDAIINSLETKVTFGSPELRCQPAKNVFGLLEGLLVICK